MAAEIGVVPPQPKRRVVMRRVKARLMACVGALSATAAVAMVALFAGNGSPVVGAVIVLLVASTLVAAIVALFFAFAEKPTPVEIVEDSREDGLIHLSGDRQRGPPRRSSDP